MENHVDLTAEQSREARSSTAAHTPGPWVAIHEPGHSLADMTDNGGYRIDAPDDRVTQLAFVWVLNRRVPLEGTQSEGEPFGDVRAGANARLIAAAPELLAALRIARDCVLESFEYVRCLDDQIMADARLQRIDAAIAKATGAA